VYDVFEMASSVARTLRLLPVEEESSEGYEEPSEGYHKWGESVVDRLEGDADRSRRIYDTVLIDEAQDFKEWMLRFAEAHAAAEASVFVAETPGFELYGGRAQWLHGFQERAGMKPVCLARSFRNARPTFQLAKVFYDTYPERPRISDAVQRLDRDGGYIFDTDRANTPTIRVMTRTKRADSHVRTSLVKEILRDETAEIARHQGDLLDLMLLVPYRKRSNRTHWALRCIREALCALSVDYIDYTDASARRRVPRPDQVRVCTYHSARGLEARHVVLFGFESLNNISKSVGCSANNIGYVALSRSRFDTTIVCSSQGARSRPITHVKAILEALPLWWPT
jgi:hypothetical protein